MIQVLRLEASMGILIKGLAKTRWILDADFHANCFDQCANKATLRPPKMYCTVLNVQNIYRYIYIYLIFI